ncbi:TetR/AcrR family transcriptional regulator [Microbacterium sp. ASV49]|uniref:TetR/AcrR family transcriptional regulator n=1 Tax=Microbacterium candidum TaxID=3041922 RepID=A0ABT7MU30_9MICO|nr:TetR/AcrR family transcriptional regulator [Microbacterium sp. ASV49]MDL9977954.1 TetR/AcrR family transcriptional regulator [Microbacterium sp. ASV49]
MPRPRSEKAQQAVLAAMRRAVADGGYEAVTIEGLAAEADVSKQTIYRWWPSKAAILGEALLEGEIPGEPLELPPTGDLAGDLRAWFRAAHAHLARPENIALARALIAVTATDPDLGAALNRRFARQTVAWVSDRIESARETGQVRADADAAAIADQIVAITSYAALLGRPLDDAHADAFVEVLLHGIAAG